MSHLGIRKGFTCLPVSCAKKETPSSNGRVTPNLERHHQVLDIILILNTSSVSLRTSRAPCISQRLYSDSLTISSQRCSSNNGLLSACGAGLASFDVPPRWALISTGSDCGCRTPFINRHINNFAIWHYRELAFLLFRNSLSSSLCFTLSQYRRNHCSPSPRSFRLVRAALAPNLTR